MCYTLRLGRVRVGLGAMVVGLTLLPLVPTLTGCGKRITPAGTAGPVRPLEAQRTVEVGAEGLSTSRGRFARAFARVTVGMPADRARSLLGPPDDVRTENDPGGISYTHTREIWGYGTDRHLGFPTLGTVAIDDEDRVQYLCGTSGADDLVDRLGEVELRRLLRLLARAGNGMPGDGYNPRLTITAVNALQPLGKRVGVGVLQEYLRVSFGARWNEDQGLFLVMRALFEVPRPDAVRPSSPAVSTEGSPAESEDAAFVVARPGYLRPPMLGAPDWSPHDPTRFPRFPLVIIDDIPLVPIGGYLLAGHAEPAAEHLRHLDREADWRRAPLKPSDDPLGALNKLSALLAADHDDEQELQQATRATVARQLLRLIDTAYRPSAPDEDDNACPPADQRLKSFAQVAEKVRTLHIRWDDKSNAYVNGDGKMLPPVETPAYRRSVFRPRFAGDAGYRVTLSVERLNAKRIDVTLAVDVSDGPQPDVHLRVVRLSSPEKVLIEGKNAPCETVEPTGRNASAPCWSSSAYRTELPVGERIRLELDTASQGFVSPSVEP